MTRARFVFRSVVHYRRTNLAVVLGVAVGAAALTGALVVGDSVRGSLRELALGRLGSVDYALVAPRFFREALASDLASDAVYASEFAAPCPLIVLSGAGKHPDSGARANQITILGVDDGFWKLSAQPTSTKMPEGRSVLLNIALAEELGASVGQDVLLNFGRHDAVATETLLGRRDETTTTLRVTVAGIVPAEGLGAFSPNPSKATPKNAFVPLSVMQKSLNQSDRVNGLLVRVKWPPNSRVDWLGEVLQAATQRGVRLEDLGLRLRENVERGYVSLESESLLIPLEAERAVEPVGPGCSKVLTHLANSLRKEGATTGIPYSTIAAIDPTSWDGRILTQTNPDDPPGLQDGELLLNQWTADDLGVKPGDRVTLTYYVSGAFGAVETRQETFALRGVVAMSGLGTDAGFVPEYKGITDTRNLADWNPPFPVDLRTVRDEDEEYWDKYKTTPKAFVTLADGQRLWADQPERFGRLTSIRHSLETNRFSAAVLEIVSGKWELELLHKLTPSEFGLSFEPVRSRVLAASSGNTDFGMLFIGFSSFLILSAAMLVALLFRLSVERRSAEFGVMLATGLEPRAILRMLLTEGAALSVIGSIVGVAAAGGYAWLMLAGLRTWWSGAVNAPFLKLYIEPCTMGIGAVSGVVVAMMATAWSVRGLLGRSPRALIGGAIAESSLSNGRRGRMAPMVCALAIIAAFGSIVASSVWPVIPEAVGFFLAGASMLTACLTGLACRLRRVPHAVIDRAGWVSMIRLALRNAQRFRGRSLLTAALIACAAFVVLALEAFRLDDSSTTDRASGTGGYSIYAESVTPLVYDLNTPAGREAMNLTDPALIADAGFSAIAYRLRPGDESSCRSLYRPDRPRVLGVSDAAVERGGFAFSASLAESDAERANPWTLLRREFPDGAIPAIGDEASVKWQLHLGLGQDLVFKDEGGGEVRLRFVALLKQSVLQNEILIAEPRFTRLFPSVSGYGFFLIEASPDRADAVEQALESKLDRFGLDAAPTRRRLAEFHAVQNTYLLTFQALGGLGLVLGSAGLAAVMLRNIWERRRELALMRAVGFAGRLLGVFVLVENLALVALGLLAAVVSAAIATAPALSQHPAEIPWSSVALTLALVILVATLACLAALAPMFRVSTHQALRGE